MAVHDLNPINFGPHPYRWVTLGGRDYVQTRTGIVIGSKHQRPAPRHQSASADYVQRLLLEDRRNRPAITEHWILDVMDGPRWPWAFVAAAIVGTVLALARVA